MFIDLSQVFYDGMPGVRFKRETGETVELTAHIRPYMTHAQSSRHYQGKASFEITDVAFQSSVGTKLDAPRHRFQGADDVASLELDRLVLDGIVIDAPNATRTTAWLDRPTVSRAPRGSSRPIEFRLDRYWATETYRSHPFISRDF